MMSRAAEIFDFLKTCSKLADVWLIAGKEDAGESVIIPSGSSERTQIDEFVDIHGNYNAEIVPTASVYEDFQINCYRFIDKNDGTDAEDNLNVLGYDDVLSICEWIEMQDSNENFPEIGESVVNMECNPFVPQVRYVDNESGIIAYFITLRIRYVNKKSRRSVYYEG